MRSSEDKCTLACPTCRKVVKISTEGVQDLPVHFLVSSLKDTVDMEQKVNICFMLIHIHVQKQKHKQKNKQTNKKHFNTEWW